jgi:putative transposase
MNNNYCEENKFADQFKLKSSRLNNWDYSTPGYYFITIKTLNNNNFFGKIINNQMELSKMGIIANQYLINIPKHFSTVRLDEYIIMPNHVHIIIQILNNFVETRDRASLLKNNKFYQLAIKSNQTIPKIISQYKSSVTRQINPKTIFFAWQPRFHDQIIKNKKELLIVKNYIINNPINWQKDKFYNK